MKKETIKISNCCYAKIHEGCFDGVCSKCKEHCTPAEPEQYDVDPCDDAREYNDAVQWAEHPTPYDPR